jgi:hypothetical protein
MKEVVCNYAIARFRPYRETGEFANIGVVLICPQLDYFGYEFEKRKHKRITDFFPELDLEIFKAGLSGQLKELNRMARREDDEHLNQLVLREESQASLVRFRELVRPRETLFNFGETGTVIATDPHAKLKELFDYYVKRQFATDREYQEVIMRRHLAEFLRKVELDKYYKPDPCIGNEDYHIPLPFVYREGNTIRKAIKPLHLDKEAPTDIYRHGDAWIACVRRLKKMDRLPKEILFTVKAPKTGSRRVGVADEICRELENQGAFTLPYSDTNRILGFARI